MISSLEAIKEAIGGLPESDRAALGGWLNLRNMDDWDQQMHRDFSPGGCGQSLVDKVRADVRAGKFGAMNVAETPDESN